MLRVGIYTRISSDDAPIVRRRGVVHQARDCRAFAEQRGWAVVDVYEDNSISASSPAGPVRPEYDRLLIDLAAGRIDRILVLGQDRLLRRPEQLETLFRVHANLGIPTIETVTGPPIDMMTSTGRTHARIKAVFDAAYAEYVSEKLCQYKRDLAERGLPRQGGRRPFGYTTDGLDIIDDEADLVVEAFDRILNDAHSLGSIARDWNGRGVRTTKDNPWHPGVLRAMLVRPRNAGLREYRGTILGPAVWPPIITPDTRVALLAALEARSRRKGHVVRRRLLTGLLICGKCGQPLNGGGTSRGTRGEYRCDNAWGRAGCGGTSIRALPVERHVAQRAVDELDRADRVRMHATTALRDRMERDRQRLADLARAHFVDAAITREEWHGVRDALQADIHRAEMHLTLQSRRVTPDVVRRQWPTLDTPQMRAVLERVIDHVVVGPATGMRHHVDLSRLDIHYRAHGETR